MNSRAFIEKITAVSGFTESAGVEVEQVEKGRVVLRLARKKTLTQFNGFFHGGAISGLADHAAGAAATSALGEGLIAVTVDLQINFMEPANSDALVAEATVIKSGKLLSVVSVKLRNSTASSGNSDNDQTLCALATVTLRNVDSPAI